MNSSKREWVLKVVEGVECSPKTKTKLLIETFEKASSFKTIRRL